VTPALRALLARAARARLAAGNFYAPRNVGIHHTLYGAGTDARFFPTWSSRYVQPSNVPTGQLAATAGDQIPGFSYYWSAGGRGGASEAANLARGQTALQFERQILDDATRGVGKVTTTPRFGPVVDPNLPGTRARMIYGPQSQRVVGEVASAAGPLTSGNAAGLASMANRQKALEAARSASRIGGTAAVAAAAPGFARSGIDSFLAPRASDRIGMIASNVSSRNIPGAAGSALGAVLAGPPDPFYETALGNIGHIKNVASAARAKLQAKPSPSAASLKAQAQRYSAQAPARPSNPGSFFIV